MELGLELPVVPKPMAEYVPAKRVEEVVYVSGQAADWPVVSRCGRSCRRGGGAWPQCSHRPGSDPVSPHGALETQNPTDYPNSSPPALDFPQPPWYTMNVKQVRHMQTKMGPLGVSDVTG